MLIDVLDTDGEIVENIPVERKDSVKHGLQLCMAAIIFVHTVLFHMYEEREAGKLKI